MSEQTSASQSVSMGYHLKKLYIKNLDFKTIAEDIKDKFCEFGDIISCDIPKDHDKPDQCKGFAFVEFVTEASAQKAKQELNESKLLSRTIYVDVSNFKLFDKASSPKLKTNRIGLKGDPLTLRGMKLLRDHSSMEAIMSIHNTKQRAGDLKAREETMEEAAVGVNSEMKIDVKTAGHLRREEATSQDKTLEIVMSEKVTSRGKITAY